MCASLENLFPCRWGSNESKCKSVSTHICPPSLVGLSWARLLALFMKNLLPWKLLNLLSCRSDWDEKLEALVLFCHLPLCPFQILCWNSYAGVGVGTCSFMGQKIALNNRILVQIPQFRVVPGFISTAGQGQPTYSYQMETVPTLYLAHALEVMPRI